LLQTLEDGTPKAISNGMMMLIRSCSELQDDNWTVEKLSNTDLEWLFIQIRMKSVGESTKVLLPCVNQQNGCEEKTPVEIEFDRMKIIGEMNEPKVQITDTVGVVLRIPSYLDIQDLYESGEDIDTDNIFKVLNKCIVQIFDADEVQNRSDFTEKELDDFMNELSTEQFNNVMEWFNELPKLVKNVEFECSKCSTHNEVKLEGIQNFFV
jgi:hypothetical protein